MKTNEITIIAIFISMIAITVGLTIPTGIGVPITLQTFFVMLIGLMLKPKVAISTIVGYVLIGIIGIPVFSNYTSGFSVITSPTGGFIIGFVIAVTTISLIKQYIESNILNELILAFIATIIIYISGMIYMSILLETNITVVYTWMQVYFIGDLLKIIGAAIISIKLKDRIKDLQISKEGFSL